MEEHRDAHQPAGRPDRSGLIAVDRRRADRRSRADRRCRAGRRCGADAGVGLLSTIAAIGVFLVFLLFAVQLLVGLWGRSVVTAAAYDGARHVAGRRGQLDRSTAVREAEDRIRQQLGGIGRTARITWPQLGPDTIEVRIEADNPRLLSPTIAGPLATDHIDRTVVVRVERER